MGSINRDRTGSTTLEHARNLGTDSEKQRSLYTQPPPLDASKIFVGGQLVATQISKNGLNTTIILSAVARARPERVIFHFFVLLYILHVYSAGSGNLVRYNLELA